MKRYVALMILVLSIPTAAQQPAAPKPPASPRPPQAPSAPPGPLCLPGTPNCNPAEGGQSLNIRLDVAVTDHTANGAAPAKALMVVLADRAMGQTRASYEDRSISVDARPVIIEGRIRVNVTVQSQEPTNIGPPKVPDPIVNWRNSFSLLLESGKPLIALETSDAVTKRKMSIEVKATIQK